MESYLFFIMCDICYHIVVTYIQEKLTAFILVVFLTKLHANRLYDVCIYYRYALNNTTQNSFSRVDKKT